MNENIAQLKLQSAWRECQRNRQYMTSAMDGLKDILPMTGVVFSELNDDNICLLDQFIFRFSKLQDAMGNRLFSGILQFLQEPYEDCSMLDKLNRLEKLGYLPAVEAWQNIRNTRNKFTHDYPDDWERNAALINLACEAAKEMNELLEKIGVKLRGIEQSLTL